MPPEAQQLAPPPTLLNARARHWFLSWKRLIQYSILPSDFFKICFNITSYHHTDLPSSRRLPSYVYHSTCSSPLGSVLIWFNPVQADPRIYG